jgi:hypothetical protein
MPISWYSIRLSLPSSEVIFNGFFSVDDSTHIVQTFFDATNPTVDIRSTGNNGAPTYLYYPGWLCFDGEGCHVTRFPYLYGDTTGNYNMSGNTASRTGNRVDSLINVIYAFAPLSPPPLMCFQEGTEILTNTGYRNIETLQKGDLIKTVRHGYKPIVIINNHPFHHIPSTERIKNQLYVCRSDQYPEVTKDLVLIGCHSTLVNAFKDGEREKTQAILGRACVTDNYCRLPVCIDSRAAVYETEGLYNIYHITLEHDNYYMRYGIYANGLLVDSASKLYLQKWPSIMLPLKI